MVLRVLGSGSSGNCYILKADSGQYLIIEAGIKWPKIIEGVDWNISTIAGCIISHRHIDHSLCVDTMLTSGIEVYANKDTLKHSKLGEASIFAHEISPGNVYQIGEFTIAPYEAKHDVPCLCFLIKHREMGSLFFATDTCDISHLSFSRLNHLMIEANYSEKLLKEAVCSRVRTSIAAQRVLNSHLSIMQVKRILPNLIKDKSKLYEIILLHMSQICANSIAFCDLIYATSKIQTYAAHLIRKDFKLNK